MSDASGGERYRAPLVEGDPVEVEDRVFVIPDRRVSLVPNVGFVVGERATLVVDTGAGPRNGATVLQHARRLSGGRPVALAVTQVDPGHAFGAQAFKGEATIVLSRQQQERLRRHAPAYARTFREDLGPAVAEALDGLELVEPDVVHDGRLLIDLGGVRVQLESWGPAHTADDQTVLVDDRVLFGGDLFETRMFAILPWFPPFDTHFDGGRWLAALDALIAADPRTVVPGHGEATDVAAVREVRTYLGWLRDETLRARAGGASREETERSIEAQAVARWADWEVPRWVRSAVRAVWSTEEPARP